MLCTKGRRGQNKNWKSGVSLQIQKVSFMSDDQLDWEYTLSSVKAGPESTGNISELAPLVMWVLTSYAELQRSYKVHQASHKTWQYFAYPVPLIVTHQTFG